MAVLTIQIKGPAMVIRSASLNQRSWKEITNKIAESGSGGFYNLLEDEFFMGTSVSTKGGKPVLHWHDLDEDLYLLGALPGKRATMNIRHSARRKNFRKTLNQLLEHGMLFPLFHNSIRSIGFDPESEHGIAVAESRTGPVYTFSWEVPDMELFNPEALEFCWVKVNLFEKREFLLFTDVLYKGAQPKEVKMGKTLIKSWEIIVK
jgi:hypothetical protein